MVIPAPVPLAKRCFQNIHSGDAGEQGEEQVFTHVVLMKFTDAADAAKARSLLEGLASTIDEIATLTVALDTLRTPVSYDLCMISTHTDVDALRAYQSHPAHLEVAGWLKPRLAARVVVDY
ncbi:Dabb family protein [Micromonospora zamorensis]|uniref:Dabb family protein n=1 Tax=Micromonospora zamorensis TaxID=709883 RepID=UPI003797745A